MMNHNQNCGGQVHMPGLAQPPCPSKQANMNHRHGNVSACSSPGHQRIGGCLSHQNHAGSGLGPVISEPSCGCSGNSALSPAFDQNHSKFPVGMGYVPWQTWETPYQMSQGFSRGTIFPSLDYPFMMGRCRR